jgi:glycosyltransferase involved in cell wall biosynthesis
MSDGVSVIICCHNSAQRLPETLRHLAAQRLSTDIPWEVVVIDNASTDDTAQTALRLWPSLSPAPLRVVSESKSGLSHARIRGIREARYEVISFIDDDNWAALDWIQRVHATFAHHPEIGALGGRIEAVCETTPPAWFEPVQTHYAVGKQYGQSGDITDATGTLLCGAGLTLRTGAVRKLLENGFVFMMSGRKGGRLTAGEDTELCFALRACGWRFWYDNELVLEHFIPQERLQWSYAVKLMRGLGESSPFIALYLFALNGPLPEAYPAWKKTWSFQFLKVLWKAIRVAFRHPDAPFRQPEGSPWVLEWGRVQGHASALWDLRGRYTELQESIRHSAWAKARPLSGG